MPNETAPQRETHSRLAKRLGVSTKTLDRWIDVGILPEPLRIRSRKYWPAGIEPQRDAGKRSKPVGRGVRREPVDWPTDPPASDA